MLSSAGRVAARRGTCHSTLINSASYSGSIATSTGALAIGGNSIWDEYFVGRIDDLRIYNRALSASEITSDMNTAVGAQAPGEFWASGGARGADMAGGVFERGLSFETLGILSRPAQQSVVLTTTRTITYSYDALQRLVGATEAGLSANAFVYAYDAAGNRTEQWQNGVQTQLYSYNAADQVTNPGWNYDAAGNLLSDGTTSYSYDPLGRVGSITSAGQTRATTYNGDGVLVAETLAGTTTRYTQDLAGPLSQILSDGSQRYVYGNERLFGQSGSARTWYAGDALGSVRAAIDDAGQVVAIAHFDPWGVPQGEPAAPFGFTGELPKTQDPRSPISDLDTLISNLIPAARSPRPARRLPQPRPSQPPRQTH